MFCSHHVTSRILAVISLYLLSFVGDVLSASTNGELFMKSSASIANLTVGVECMSMSYCALLCRQDADCGQAVYFPGNPMGTCFNSPTEGILYPGTNDPTQPALVGHFRIKHLLDFKILLFSSH